MTTTKQKQPTAIQWFLAVSLVALVFIVIVAGIFAGELNFSATVTLLMVPIGAIVAAFMTGFGGRKDE